MTLDVNFDSFEEPKEFLFFKKLGISISSFTPEKSIAGRVCDDTLLYLHVTTLSGRKQIVVETEYETLHSPEILGFFYTKSHVSEEILQIKKKMDLNLDYRIYFLGHSFLDLRSEFSKFESADIDLSRVTFLISNYGQILNLHSKKTVQTILKNSLYNEFIVVNPYKEVKQVLSKEKQPGFEINFFFLIRFLRLLLAPGYFVKKQFEKMRINNFIWFLRLDELFSFLYFIVSFLFFKSFGVVVDSYNFAYRMVKVGGIRLLYGLRHLLLMTGFKSFGVFVDSYQVMRTAAIKTGFFIKHILLMTGFKSFGILVDSYQIVRTALIKLGFTVRHIILMAAFKTYGLLVDSYYFIAAILKIASIKVYFIVRHAILISYFKSFGFIIDAYYLILAMLNKIIVFTHLYLMYPFRKIYWFTNYQYKKRIKKEIQ